MGKLICEKCMAAFLRPDGGKCDGCGSECYDFSNDDAFLKRETPKVVAQRRAAGLDGLVGGLNSVIVNTEPEQLEPAVAELVKFTGLELEAAFEDAEAVTFVLKRQGSADFLVRSRKTGSPFPSVADHPKAKHLPNTRLETFVFETGDLEKYVSIQRARGVLFLTEDIQRRETYLFIQTIPSTFTGVSIGFVQWLEPGRRYETPSYQSLAADLPLAGNPVMQNVKELDHAAIRVAARDRDAAILEFMMLTNYNFEFSIYVKMFNSITNVSRLSKDDFALVFTSGIRPFVDEETSGPTEKFLHNYGKRVHHLAFRTERIEATYAALKAEGMEFLVGLVGSEGEGIKQTFTAGSANTLLVNEYICRYGDFDGFFSPKNVMLLTESTDRQ